MLKLFECSTSLCHIFCTSKIIHKFTLLEFHRFYKQCQSVSYVLVPCHNVIDVMRLVSVRWKMSAYQHFIGIPAVRRPTGTYTVARWTGCTWRNVFQWRTSWRRGCRPVTATLCWRLCTAAIYHTRTVAWRISQLCMWTATTTSTTSHHAVSTASTLAHHHAPVLPTRPTSAAVCLASCRQRREQPCIFHRHLQKTLIRTLYWHKRITTCRAGV